jgi:hypothetical protein
MFDQAAVERWYALKPGLPACRAGDLGEVELPVPTAPAEGTGLDWVQALASSAEPSGLAPTRGAHPPQQGSASVPEPPREARQAGAACGKAGQATLQGAEGAGTVHAAGRAAAAGQPEDRASGDVAAGQFVRAGTASQAEPRRLHASPARRSLVSVLAWLCAMGVLVGGGVYLHRQGPAFTDPVAAVEPSAKRPDSIAVYYSGRPDAAPPPLRAADDYAGSGHASVRRLLALSQGEVQRARQWLDEPCPPEDCARYPTESAVLNRDLPTNLRLVRYLTLARRPGRDADAGGVIASDVGKELSRLLAAALDDPRAGLPEPSLAFAATGAFGSELGPAFSGYLEVARARRSPGLLDDSVTAYAAAVDEPSGMQLLTEAALTQSAAYGMNLSDGAIAAIVSAAEAATAEQAFAQGAPESIALELLRWEHLGRSARPVPYDDLTDGFRHIMLCTPQHSSRARQLRTLLWEVLGRSADGRSAYWYALAQARSRPDAAQAQCWSRSRQFFEGGTQLHDLAPRDLAGGNEHARLWHRLLVSHRTDPIGLRDWPDELFRKDAAGPVGANGDASTLMRYASCFASVYRCEAPMRPPVADVPADAADSATRPLRLRALLRHDAPPHLPRAFWMDAAALLARQDGLADLSAAGLEALLPLVSASLVSEPGAAGRDRLRRGLAGELERRLRDAGLHERLRKQLAWWIENQSAWDPLAINFRARRIGLLQRPCPNTDAPALRRCYSDLLAKPAQSFVDDLEELTRIARFAKLPVGQDVLAADLEVWARFYAGEAAVSEARRIAAERSEATQDARTAAYLNDFWFLLLEDSDIALLLLRFKAERPGI